MKTIESVKKVIADRGGSIIEDDEHADVVFGISATNGSYVCQANVYEGPDDDFGDIIVFESFSQYMVPREKVGDVMRFINILNFSLTFGSFYIDICGIVHCKTSIQIPREKIDVTVIDNVIAANGFIMDDHIPMILNVARGYLPSHNNDEDIFADLSGEIPVV